jgi:hypothetical protein
LKLRCGVLLGLSYPSFVSTFVSEFRIDFRLLRYETTVRVSLPGLLELAIFGGVDA